MKSQHIRCMEKKSYKTNKFKISTPTWNEEFELTDASYYALEIQDYFEYTLKKHGEKTNNPSIRIYINEIENSITFKMKTGYFHELLMPETMKLLGSTKTKLTKDKNGENLPPSEINELLLVHCSTVNNDYQQDSRELYASIHYNLFGKLSDISPKNFIFLKTFDSEF